MSYDVIIVGAGIAGLRVGIETLTKSPTLRCCIIEKYKYTGGRVVTYHKELPKVGALQWENGAGRISISHKKVLKLLKKYDLTFIGGLNEERQKYIDKFGIKHISAFGRDYVEEIKRSKICFNKSISHDLNAKYFEILGAGSFMLTNENKSFLEFVDNNEYIEKMFYYSDDDLQDKINYYLKNEDERDFIAKKANEFILENHTFESRIKIILENVL